MSNLTQLLTALVSPAQDVENVLQQLLTERSVDNAIGAQLDVIGRLVGQVRGTSSDDIYRRYIRARISVHRSKGTTEDLITVARLVIDDALARVQVDNQGAAAVVVRWLQTVADTDVADALIAFLKPTVSGGVRVILETITALDDDSFMTALTTFSSGAITIGMTRLYYDIDQADMNPWPNTGTFVVDLGDGVLEETITYTAFVRPNLSASPYFVVNAVTKNHADRSLLICQGTPGRGFGDEADASVGGKLAQARD